MAQTTGIEWCDATFNPWWGCVKVSPGCAHCYADTLSKRYAGGVQLWGDGHQFRFFGDKHWQEPLKWARTLPAKLGRRPRVFCASMADVFEERDELHEHRYRLFDLIADTPELDWLILTKRPEFARDWLRIYYAFESVGNAAIGATAADERETEIPFPNLWLGVSIENARFTWRADVLREIPAAVRFISAEPLLGSLFDNEPCTCDSDGIFHYPECRVLSRPREERRAPLDLTGIDWVIIGGESGPKARRFHVEHAREIVDAALAQCGTCGRMLGREGVARASVAGESHLIGQAPVCDRHTAIFVKQLGKYPWATWDHDGHTCGARLFGINDAKGGDWSEWPADLRIREFPGSVGA